MYSMKIRAKDSWPIYSVYMSHGRVGNFKTSEHSFIHHSLTLFVYDKNSINHDDDACFSTSDRKKGQDKLKDVVQRIFFSATDTAHYK